MHERRTATPSEAILAVSRLLGEIAAAETREDVRAALVREARALFVADGAVLLGVDAQAGTLTVLEADPPGSRGVPGASAPVGTLPAVDDLLARGMRSLQAPLDDAALDRLVGWSAQPHATLFVAIRDHDATRHVLCLTCAREGAFDPSEQDLAAAFAAAAAGALAQVRLADERDHRIAQLSALARAAKTVNQSLELAPLLTAICAEARTIAAADAVVIYLRDDQGDLIAEAADGLGDHMIGYRLGLGEGLAGRVAEQGRSLAAEDYQASAAPPPDSPLADICSALAVPMFWDGELRGVLSVGFRSAHAAEPEETRLLETFGELAAAACRNANAATGLALAARTDALTGCLNHAALHEGLRLEIERSARTDQPLSVVMVDLDEFKLVNERHGHLVGDEVLRRVGHALRSAVRPYDLCARYGGDEFVIVCSDADEEAAAEVAARAMERVDAAVADIPEGAGTGATVGVALWIEGQTTTELLAQADRALLYGKQQGHRREVVLGSELPKTFRPLRFRRASPEAMDTATLAARGQAERLQKRTRQLALASSLGARLAGLHEPQALVDAAVDELHRAFGYHLCEIVRRRDDGAVEAVAVRGDGMAALGPQPWSQPADAGLIGRALDRGQVVTISDVRDEPGYVALPGSGEVRSELVAPIRVGTRLWGAINVEETRVEAFDDEDARLVQIVAEQLGAALRSAELYQELEDAYLGTADALSAAIDARAVAPSPGANGSIVGLCEAVGRRLGMSPEELRDLRYGAALHDVGKIVVPEEILAKSERLDASERAIVEGHAIAGEQLLGPIGFLAGVSPLVRHEHERWDGHGYPDGLAGTQIPVGARIIAACEAYVAMTSDRPYRRARPEADARAELRRNAGTQFDPDVVEALCDVLAGEGNPTH